MCIPQTVAEAGTGAATGGRGGGGYQVPVRGGGGGGATVPTSALKSKTKIITIKCKTVLVWGTFPSRYVIKGIVSCGT